MPTVRFDLNQEYLNRLDTEAAKKGMNRQEFIRYKLFGMETVFTVDEAISRVHALVSESPPNSSVEFTLPELFPEWNMDRGPSGVFGRNFYKYVLEHPELGINFVGLRRRRALYAYNESEEHDEQANTSND